MSALPSTVVDSVVEVENLSVRYERGGDTVDALDGVSFSVDAGERVAIIGRSGSGKSTLMKVLSGLVSADSGHIRVDDHILGPDDRADRSFYSDVGLVFQDYGLVPQLTAMQNVMCGQFHNRHALSSLGRFSGTDHVRARRILTQLGLGDRLNTRTSRLSGGEQQRVAICRLLFQKPTVMLLDEPVSSLDIHWAKTAVDMMSDVDESSTLIMVLHDLTMAREFADRVLFMHNGEIIFDGDPHEACCRLEMDPMPCAGASTGKVLDDRAPIVPPPSLGAAGCPEGRSCSTPPKAAPVHEPTENPSPNLKEPTPDGLGGLWGKGSFYATVVLCAIALYIWAALGVEFSLARIFTNLEHAVDFGDRMFPPDFSVTSTVASSLVETIQMALIGTTLAAVLSLPLAILAARNISARPLQAGARLILNGLRTIPSIIWGLFFVAIVGLGPFPGILALTFYASGYLGKFYYEGIESIDPGPLRSLRTVGASPIQRFRWGVFPQVLPLMLGYTLYMFEYNVRAASILGIVGAGGIGFYLYNYINNFQYDRAATALLLLLVVVTLIDSLSSRLRARISEGA